jgi:hypothetical protein
MIKYIATFFAFVVMPQLGIAETWVRVTNKPIDGLMTEIDRGSITKYQGVVAFKVRTRVENKQGVSGTFYNQLFTFCKNREVWDISSNLILDGSDNAPTYEVTPSLYGPTSSEGNKRAGNHPLVLEACKRLNSKVNLELPISLSPNEFRVLLPAETRITDNLVSLWIKEYPIEKKTHLKSDGTPIIFMGEPMTYHEIIKNGGYSLTNWVSNCLDDTSALAALHNYGNSGVYKDSISIPREKLQFTGNVPESVGRRIHDVACELR